MADTPDPRKLLDIADRFYVGSGRREQAMRHELNLSATRFAQLLYEVVTNPPVDVAVEYGPTILRLRRRLEAGQRQRAPRRMSADDESGPGASPKRWPGPTVV